MTTETTAIPDRLVHELADITDQASRTRYLVEQRELFCADAVKQLTEQARTKLRVNTRHSLSLAEAAVAIASEIDDRSLLGLSLRSKANALYVLGDNQTALEYHAQALGIFRDLSDPEQEARTLNSSIQPFILLGKYDQALEAAGSARIIFERLSDQRHLSHLEINTGNVYHRQDRFEEGLACYERAYEMLLPLRDAEGLAVALYNMSVCLISLNDFPRALASYQRARELCVSHGMTLLVGQSDYNIAYLYYLRGEYGRAIDMLRTTRALCEKNGDAYVLALCYLDVSDIYLELHLSAEASESAHEGVVRFRKLGMGYEEAKCLANEAIALAQRGKAVAAIDLFAQARAIFVREKNLVWPWLVDLYRALVLFEEGRLFEARKFCQDALDFFESGNLGKAVSCLLLLARIELRSGDIEGARRYCDEALRRLPEGEQPIHEFQASLLMGHAWKAADDLRSAYAFYQRARISLEALRTSLRKDELKIALVKDKSEVYECLVEICLGEGNGGRSDSEAFDYIESAKCRNLMDMMLQEAEALQDEAAGQSEMVRRIRSLRVELNWYYHRIEAEELQSNEMNRARIEQLKEEARVRETDLVRVLHELPESEPEAALLRGLSGTPLQDIQANLPEGTSLIEYFSVKNRLMAALVTRKGLEIFHLSIVTRVAGMAHILRTQLARFPMGTEYGSHLEGASLQGSQKHLRDLYRELVEPLRGRLEGQHLVFVPHGILHALPLHALFDGRRYLIDDFSVSYAPSANIYRLCQSRPAPRGDARLILGVPDSEDRSVSDELAAVALAMKSANVFLGQEAAEQVLRKQSASARWIHIATNGSRQKKNPRFSGIPLGESHLSSLDIYQLRLPAELITLTGCAADLNSAVAGDELLGLTRILLIAGAHSLLLTLWDVRDESTCEFMKTFYSSLHVGKSKARALQESILQLRKRHPHPYYWAPFFLVGDV